MSKFAYTFWNIIIVKFVKVSIRTLKNINFIKKKEYICKHWKLEKY